MRYHILLFLGICMACSSGLSQSARAESIDIIFSGVVPPTCAIAFSPQSMGGIAPEGMHSNDILHAGCNDATQISVGQWEQEPDTQNEGLLEDSLSNVTMETITEQYRTITPQ